LVAQANAIGQEWIDPHIGLNETGEVAFEWWNDEKKLTLYIAPDMTRYVSSWGANIETEMNAGSLVANQFANLWRWLRVKAA
jgi:hypothetical protein